MRMALTSMVALMLTAGCASNPVREPAPLPGSDLTLLRHLLADIDSVRPWEHPTSVPLYIEYRPYRTRHTRETIPENEWIAATSPSVLKQRINAILSAGKDTVSVSPYGKCPGMIPDASREACPNQLMTILAFSDTFTLPAGAGLGSTDLPQLMVVVDRTYLTPSGKHIEAFYYTLEHGPAGWRTVRRHSGGVGH
jgi:hypothetical protein